MEKVTTAKIFLKTTKCVEYDLQPYELGLAELSHILAVDFCKFSEENMQSNLESSVNVLR